MDLPIAVIDQESLSRFEEAIKKEWIITNGLGGYASSTVLGINTRKYHGLLVAAFHPPCDRRVYLAKLDEEINIDGNVLPIGANEFRDGIFPRGYTLPKEFSASPFPKYTYALRSVELSKTVLMPWERNAIVILYEILNKGADVKIQVSPLVNWRHFHSTTDRWKDSEEPSQKPEERSSVLSFDVPRGSLMMKAIEGRYSAGGKWVESMYYREEAGREESYLDDCYQSGFFEFEAKAGEKSNCAIVAVADVDEESARKVMGRMPATFHDMATFFEREIRRHKSHLSWFYRTHEKIPVSGWLSRIVLGTSMFIVKGLKAEQRSVIAGYHWFEAWGRDTFVSLPGLMLITRSFEDAKKVFLNFKEHSKGGLIPNFVSDSAGEPAYNSVDATLWYVNAVLQYLKHSGDFGFVREQLWESMKAIFDSFRKGTVYDIHADDDGLLVHGPQLTWMDATVDGQPVTPRSGSAVEAQALWFNALRTLELLATKFNENDKAEEYSRMADLARRSFNERFWNPDENCLYDTVKDGGKDGSLRPNQIIAAALDFSMLDRDRLGKVVEAVQQRLLTPFGLMSLDRNDPMYRGICAGDRRSRDRAYHNGTVWPWLLGPFTTAFLKANERSEQAREYALNSFLLPLFTKWDSVGSFGTVNEIFDGDPPHRPRGCIAQAWSLAEPFRAYVEDVIQVRPEHEKEVVSCS